MTLSSEILDGDDMYNVSNTSAKTVSVEAVKEFIRRLKSDCFICGKKIRSQSNQSQLCNYCFEGIRMRSRDLKEKFFKKIDKHAGPKFK